MDVLIILFRLLDSPVNFETPPRVTRPKRGAFGDPERKIEVASS